MGYASISMYGASPVFQTLVSQGQVSTPEFGFYFAESGSELYIGGTNPNHYTGSFTYMPVTKKVKMHGTVNFFSNNKYFRVSGNACLMVFLSTENLSSEAPAPSSILAPPWSSVTHRVYRTSMTRFLAPNMLVRGFGPVRS